MNSSKNRIFLCHAREDHAEALKMYKKLKVEGFDPWLDKKDLLPGQNWRIETPKALKSARFVIIFFSKTSVSHKGFVQKEFKLALDTLQEMPDGELFIIPVRLDICKIPDSFADIHYCDLFEESGVELVLKTIKSVLGETELLKKQTKPKVIFRSQLENSLSEEAVKQMLQKHDFYDSSWNKSAKGFTNDYKARGKVVVDKASGLMWQRSGTSNRLIYLAAENYIAALNINKFSGYSDWRLPTLEEVTSVLEPRQSDELYINAVFGQTQLWIWTADKNNAERAWYVNFSYGYCSHYPLDLFNYVRAVRSDLS